MTTITPYHVLVTEVIFPEDKRNDSKVFHNAKNDETRGLIEGSALSTVNVQLLLAGANIIGGRFANVLKNAGTAGSTRLQRQDEIVCCA